VQVHLLAVGTRMPAWVETAFADYAGRLPHELRLRLREIPAPVRGKGADIPRLRQQEGEKLLKALPRDAEVIALDERGSALDTRGWAAALARWLPSGRDTALLIGGPDGLAPEVLARADQRWSLSPLTLPHPLVRVLVAEQLYRAWTLHVGHPYHRA
jgi:23S rRNA (pseudouridine1915-N3)-methyltransferase